MKLARSFLRCSLVVAVLMALTTTLSKTQVNVKLGIGTGAMVPMSDFNGSTADFYNGSRYGFHSGPNIHGKAKVGWSGWNFIGEIDYSALRNSGNAELGLGVVDISQQVLSLKVGPEYHFSIPALPVTPFVGVNFALNRFTGEMTFQGVAKVPSATFGMNDAIRYGVGFSTGMEVSLGSDMSLDLNVSYNLMNVFGKEWNNIDTGNDQRLDSYLALNDDRDPLYAVGDDKHFISHERNIQSILFTVSFLFSF
jgi:hypothetical protein